MKMLHYIPILYKLQCYELCNGIYEQRKEMM